MQYKNATNTTLHVEGYKMLGPNQTIELDEDDLKKPLIKDLVHTKNWLTPLLQDLSSFAAKEEIDNLIHRNQPVNENLNVNINIPAKEITPALQYDPRVKMVADEDEIRDYTAEELGVEENKALKDYRESSKKFNKPVVHGGDTGPRHADRIPMTVDDVREMQAENEKNLAENAKLQNENMNKTLPQKKSKLKKDE